MKFEIPATGKFWLKFTAYLALYAIGITIYAPHYNPEPWRGIVTAFFLSLAFAVLYDKSQ